MLQTKFKISLQDLSFLCEMLKASVNSYAKKAVDESLATIAVDDVFVFVTLDLLHEKLKNKYISANRIKRPYINIKLTPSETRVFLKAIIPTFNNTYYALVKQQIVDACIREINLTQHLIMANFQPVVNQNRLCQETQAR